MPFYGMTPKREKEFSRALRHATLKGYRLLSRGESAVQAIEASIIELENDPLFNAGRGAVFTSSGKNLLDASIMCGKTLKAGAVARISRIKNPISLARAIMESSGNLFLVAEGAEEFARKAGFKFISPAYFFTQERYDQWKASKRHPIEEHGTVGAVALDKEGNLAAGTSTGGLVNKNDFRIGDSPIIGAGTYASNKTCAVSCTGVGESIIRAVTAHEISALLQYKKISLKRASEKVLLEKLNPFGGHAGLVAIDKHANVRCVHNTERMYRAWKVSGLALTTGIY
jgi:beta-aspartyl-peptidase (threonine type)